MLVSPPASSTSPAEYFIAHEPSSRWVRRTQAQARSTASARPATRRAIAASTWFHTSVCWPVVQGMAPSGSCIASIATPDRATCSLVRASGGIGHPLLDLGLDPGFGDRLVQVDDQALADHGVQRPLGPAGGPGPL